MGEAETGESEGQPPWAAPEPAVEERGINVDRRTKRERQKRKADQKEYVCFGQTTLVQHEESLH